jgi:ABC-type Fe3+/spermidine/putrescine transport system ATPase subunit
MTVRAAVPVRVAGIRKQYGPAAALRDVSLDFPAGGLSTLLGPSGCGKTTLLRIIAGFVEPDAGTVLVADRDVSGEPPWRRRIGFVFQSYALWPHMTVLENVAYGLRLRGLARAEVAERARGVLDRVGMGGLGGRHPGQLSGGQQQRIALARALVLEPDVLLLDEPLSNLDAQLRVDMRREIRRLQGEVGITTIYVTHDQEEALEMSDMVAVMSQGRVEQVGTAEDVYRRPRSPFVATFLGAATLLRGQAQADGTLLVDGHRLALAIPSALAGRTVRVAVRPEGVILSADPDSDPGALRATVVERGYHGHLWKVVARVGEGLDLVGHLPEAVAIGQAIAARTTQGTVVEVEE